MKYPTCNFLLRSAGELYKLIYNKLEQHEPFSFIRLGDGEGVLLSINKQSPEIDFNYLSEHLGPNKFLIDKVVDIKNSLIEAILEADVVGVRDDIVDVEFDDACFELAPEHFVEKFKKNFKLRECERNLGYAGTRRISLLYRSIRNIDFGAQIQYCSSWAHYDLQLSGNIFKILLKQNKIGLISSRSELCHRLENIFDIEVSYWDIPDMYRDLDHDQIPQNYLNRLEDLLHEQFTEFSGMLFLVGGGLYGKLYCNLIKSQGGIALDVGSLLDAWVGFHSRPSVYNSLMLMDYDGCSVPDKLLLTVENVNQLVNSHE